MVTLSGSGFVLRPYSKEDAASIVQHVNDQDIARNTAAIPYPYTLKMAKDWIVKCQKNAQKKPLEDLVFAIAVDGSVVGAIGLHHIEAKHKCELGYWLGRAYWGRGIVTEAVRLATEYAFTRLHLQRVYAKVFPYNPASMRVLEKTGFVLEGIMKKSFKKDGKLVDEHLYAKVR